jgi:predicted RNA-binding protein
MNENNELVKLVVAVLRGMNANAETMHHIINEVGIEDETRHRLNGGESVLTQLGDLAADDLINDLTDEIVSEGQDLIEDWEIEVYNKAIDLTDVSIDESTVRGAVKRIVDKHFEIV